MTAVITPDNIASHELIGLDARVERSTNPATVGLRGRVIDETKSMIILECGGGNDDYGTSKGQPGIRHGHTIKRVAKSTSDWMFDLDGSDVHVDGASIAKRPFERITTMTARKRRRREESGQ